MAGASKAATTILTNAGIITTNDALAMTQALITKMRATRMSVLTTATISTNTIGGLVQRGRTRWLDMHYLIPRGPWNVSC